MLNKSWRQHPTRHQLYGHLPTITKTIQVRRTRHAGHCWRSRDELISMYSYELPHMAGQKQDDQLQHINNSYVRIRGVVLKTYQRRWMIGRSGERGSGISVRTTRHDADDDGLNYHQCWSSASTLFPSSFSNGLPCLRNWSISSDICTLQKLKKKKHKDILCIYFSKNTLCFKSLIWF